MTISPATVNIPVEPVLFPGGALSISLEALLDPLDCTVLFVVKAFDVPTGKLVSLWSSAPVPFEDFSKEMQRAIREFRELVQEHTGPF